MLVVKMNITIWKKNIYNNYTHIIPYICTHILSPLVLSDNGTIHTSDVGKSAKQNEPQRSVWALQYWFKESQLEAFCP